MTPEEFWGRVQKIAEDFDQRAKAELELRWREWKLDLSKAQEHEVVGALLARQTTLATQLVSNPPAWTHDVGPVLLRAMADVYITLAWILEDAVSRSKDFILHAVGQAKLELEQRKAWLAGRAPDAKTAALIEGQQGWIDSQRWAFLTEVNLGSWTGKNTREIAREAGCSDFYEHEYQPFSEAVHSTWRHLNRFNLRPCDAILHGHHLVPVVSSGSSDPMYPKLAAKYLDKTLRQLDLKLGLTVAPPTARTSLDEQFDRLAEDASKGKREAP